MADDHALAHDELAVGAEHRVEDLDDFPVRALGVTQHGHIESGGAEAGDRAAALYDAAPPASRSARTPACSQAGVDEAGGPPGVLGAVADGVERRIVHRREPIIDDDAASDGQAGSAARAVEGRPPAVSTTRSVSSVNPLSRTSPASVTLTARAPV